MLKIKKVFFKKKIGVGIILFLSIVISFAYQYSRPRIIIHAYAETGYLGKVSDFERETDKLILKNYTATYYLPHLIFWHKDSEIAIFTPKYNDLFRKEDIDFLRLEIFLNKDGTYRSSKKIGTSFF